jgi:L-ascorbate 6-phosphate lactonase
MKDKTNLGGFKMSFWGDHIISDIENYQVGPGKMAIWFIGCTGIVLKSSKTLIYIDPFLGRPARPANTREMTPIPFNPEQVRKADAILSTHRHRDHCHKETLVPMYNNTEALFIGPETSIKKFLEYGIDDSRMKVMKPDEEISFFDMRIIAEASYDPLESMAISYIVQSDGGTVLHAGDSWWFDERKGGFAEIGNKWDIDVAFLATGKNPEGRQTYMSPYDFFRAARDLKTKLAVPTHCSFRRLFYIDPDMIELMGKDWFPQVKVHPMRAGDRLVITTGKGYTASIYPEHEGKTGVFE